MQILFRLFILISTLFFSLSIGYSQKTESVRILHAGRVKGTEIAGESVLKLYDDVRIKKGDVLFYCDSAVQFKKQNNFIAYGHVKMIKGDSITLTSDKLVHIGKTGISTFTGDVILNDRSMTLSTNHLDYNKNTDVANYYGKGVVVDQQVHLVSEVGEYYVNSKMFNFYTGVTVNQPNNEILSDTLRYNRITGVVSFQGPTTITSTDNDLYAELGEYHTKTDDAFFSQNAIIETPKYILKGDSLFFNNKSTNGHVLGHVIIHSKQDSLFIFGEQAIRNGEIGTMKVFGERTLMKKIQGIDTTYILADTLLAIEDTVTQQQKRILAYNDVKIYKQDMQAICDSLVNDFQDSTIYFYDNPVVWNGDNQITGDTIKAVSKDKKISRVFTNGHSFTVKNHHGQQYDQIKGRTTVAYFNQNELTKVKVFGNGECVYYINDEAKRTFTGVNRIECSEMTVKFHNQAMSDITFLSLPNAHFYPPKVLTEELKYLANFVWLVDKRPLLAIFRKVQGEYVSLEELSAIYIKGEENLERSREGEDKIKSKNKKNKMKKKGFLKKKT